ncbi:MAG: single-stranded DNA-binding protein [Candidatus Omnitrophota bacterium]|nr:single-stranded DNA-binding protein [Candidatus Omnitrophota bacterium]
MVSFNQVLLIGNLTKDPELRYTPQGTAVITLRIAVNTPFKDKSGQLQKDTCFVNVIAWGHMAENCNQYLQKGRQILVDGRLQSRSWKDKDGNNRNTIEVKASRVQFMPKPIKEETREIDLGEAPEEVLNLENNQSQESGEVNKNDV